MISAVFVIGFLLSTTVCAGAKALWICAKACAGHYSATSARPGVPLHLIATYTLICLGSALVLHICIGATL